MLLLDVDGVMTDGGIIYSSAGEEYKVFNVKDGLGIRMLLNAGIEVAIITGRKSRAVDSRARDLGIKAVYQGIQDKVAVFEEILQKHRLTPDQVGFVGDDLVDVPLLAKVGFSVGVSNAVEEVRKRVDYVTTRKGGRGAVREVCDLILQSQDKWDPWSSSQTPCPQ
ncbi:MAG: HAD family hydrolase [Deltaproteobacteria bacterium]|nr:HAD family hydrolase [Deltaproteobacteria bacterium]